MCGQSFTPSGKAAGAQVAGDCKEAQCDGKGAPVSVFAMADTKNDGNTCTTDTCAANGPASTPWGDEKCHAVCVLSGEFVATDCNGDPVGKAPAGAYATCGYDDLLAAGAMPPKWEFIGVTWEEKIGLAVEKRACGGDALAATGTIWTPFKTCAKGTECRVRFHAKFPGCQIGSEAIGKCE